ncbi:MAG: hypothetical protein A2033_17015 [Bacteroidetes bacterium GWA2_31_9]|nr:MAG: hypothetical protein A2033_17015 [Bacteroidetes bacterium GWA2_31_9]
MYKLFVLLFVLFSFILQAQTNLKPDVRLYSKYTQDYLENLIIKNPNLLEYLNFSVDNSYKISFNNDFSKYTDIPNIKKINILTKGYFEASTIDVSTFNLMEYDFIRNRDTRTYYKLADSGAILVLFSEQELLKKFKTSKIK